MKRLFAIVALLAVRVLQVSWLQGMHLAPSTVLFSAGLYIHSVSCVTENHSSNPLRDTSIASDKRLFNFALLFRNAPFLDGGLSLNAASALGVSRRRGY